MVKVVFIKPFGGKSKGEVGQYSSELASNLIRVHKVAKPYKEKNILGLPKK